MKKRMLLKVLNLFKFKVPMILEIYHSKIDDIQLGIQLGQSVNFFYLYSYNSYVYPLCLSSVLGRHQITRMMLQVSHADPNFLLRHESCFNDPSFRVIPRGGSSSKEFREFSSPLSLKGFMLTPTTISFLKGDIIHLEMFLRNGGLVHQLYPYSLIQFFFRSPSIFKPEICRVMTRHNQFPKIFGECVSFSKNFELLYLSLSKPQEMSKSYPNRDRDKTKVGESSDNSVELFDDLDYDMEELREIVKILIDYGFQYIPTRKNLFKKDKYFFELLYPETIYTRRSFKIKRSYSKKSSFKVQRTPCSYSRKSSFKVQHTPSGWKETPRTILVQKREKKATNKRRYVKCDNYTPGKESVSPNSIEKYRESIFKNLKISVPKRMYEFKNGQIEETPQAEATPRAPLIVVDPKSIRKLRVDSVPTPPTRVKRFLKWKRSKSLGKDAHLIRDYVKKICSVNDYSSSDEGETESTSSDFLISESDEDIFTSTNKIKVSRNEFEDFFKAMEIELEKGKKMVLV